MSVKWTVPSRAKILEYFGFLLVLLLILGILSVSYSATIVLLLVIGFTLLGILLWQLLKEMQYSMSNMRLLTLLLVPLLSLLVGLSASLLLLLIGPLSSLSRQVRSEISGLNLALSTLIMEIFPVSYFDAYYLALGIVFAVALAILSLWLVMLAWKVADGILQERYHRVHKRISSRASTKRRRKTRGAIFLRIQRAVRSLKVKRQLILLSLFPSFILLVSLLFLHEAIPPPPYVGYGSGDTGGVPPFFHLRVKAYLVIVEPTDASLQIFNVREELTVQLVQLEDGNPIIIDETLIVLKEKHVRSISRGLLLREIDIVPVQEPVNAQFSDGTLLTVGSREGVVALAYPEGRLNQFASFSKNVELQGLPKGPFYKAEEADNMKSYDNIDNETYTWSVRDTIPNVKLVFIQPPYHHLRPVLGPFLGITSLGQLFTVLLSTIVGGIGAIVLEKVVIPVLLDISRNRFKSRLHKVTNRKPRQMATFIVSPRGHEKKVETLENGPS